MLVEWRKQLDIAVVNNLQLRICVHLLLFRCASKDLAGIHTCRNQQCIFHLRILGKLLVHTCTLQVMFLPSMTDGTFEKQRAYPKLKSSIFHFIIKRNIITKKVVVYWRKQYKVSQKLTLCFSSFSILAQHGDLQVILSSSFLPH